MDIKESIENDITVFTLAGRVDSVTAPALQKQVVAKIDAGATRILMDGEGVDYVSSAGLHAFLAIAKALKAKGGQIAFSSLQPQVKELVEMAGLANVLALAPTRDQGLRGLRG